MLTWVLALFAAVTVVVVIRNRRALRPGWAGIYLITIGLLYQAPTAAAKLTDSYVYGRDVEGNLSVAGLGWADQLYQVADVGALAATVGLLVVNITRTRAFRVSLPAGLLAAFVLLAMLATVVATGAAPSGQPFLLFLALLAAGTSVTPIRGVVAGAALLTLATAVIGTILAIVNPAAAFSECGDKCTYIGEVFTGASSHGNALALLLTLGLPFVWVAFNGAARFWVGGYVFFLISISGSRTSLGTAAVVLLVLLVTMPTLDGDRVKWRAAWFGTLVAIAAIAAAIIVPSVVNDNQFATGRGYLWRLAWDYWSASPYIGQGTQSWSRLYDQGLFGAAAAYATHNQWVEALLLGGILGAIVFTLAMLTILFARDRGVRAAVTPVVVAIAALGVLERPIGLDLVAATSWALFAVLMVTSVRSDQSSVEGAARIQSERPIPARSR